MSPSWFVTPYPLATFSVKKAQYSVLGSFILPSSPGFFNPFGETCGMITWDLTDRMNGDLPLLDGKSSGRRRRTGTGMIRRFGALPTDKRA